jgi:hypothetical protein
MATTKKGATKPRRNVPTFPLLVNETLRERVRTRAAEIYVSPTQYFQGCVDKLIALDVPPSVVKAALKPGKEKGAHGEGPPKAQLNFELPVDKREAGHTAARSLGITLTAYLIVCAEKLAEAETPRYIAAVDEHLGEVRQAAIVEARGVLAKQRSGKGTADAAAQ